MDNKFIFDEYETNNTKIIVYQTQVVFFNQLLYIVVSQNKFNGKQYIRYGNLTQINSLKKSYLKERKFKL